MNILLDMYNHFILPTLGMYWKESLGGDLKMVATNFETKSTTRPTLSYSVTKIYCPILKTIASLLWVG